MESIPFQMESIPFQMKKNEKKGDRNKEEEENQYQYFIYRLDKNAKQYWSRQYLNPERKEPE